MLVAIRTHRRQHSALTVWDSLTLEGCENLTRKPLSAMKRPGLLHPKMTYVSRNAIGLLPGFGKSGTPQPIVRSVVIAPGRLRMSDRSHNSTLAASESAVPSRQSSCLFARTADTRWSSTRPSREWLRNHLCQRENNHDRATSDRTRVHQRRGHKRPYPNHQINESGCAYRG